MRVVGSSFSVVRPGRARSRCDRAGALGGEATGHRDVAAAEPDRDDLVEDRAERRQQSGLDACGLRDIAREAEVFDHVLGDARGGVVAGDELVLAAREQVRPRVSTVEQGPELLTWGVTIGSLIGIFSVPLTGALSDRWGRRRVYRIGSVFLLLYSFPAWWMLTLGNLIAVSGGNRVLLAIYMTVLALITTACTFLVPETLRRDLTRSKTPMRHTPPGGSPPTSRPWGR